MNKTIHYCWFGKSLIPERLRKCMDSWSEKMPDYEIRLWNEAAFDVESVSWTNSAYRAKKYAFVSDYVRLVALYQHGGIYLDTDVKLLKSLAPLQKKFSNFMGFENGKVVTSAVICVEPYHPIIKEFLDYYNTREFSDEVVSANEANVLMMTKLLEKYGLHADNTEQDVEIRSSSMHIFPQTYFCPLDFYHHKDFSQQTHAIHYFDASWLDEDTKQRIENERSILYKMKAYVLQFLSTIKHFLIK